MDLSTVLKKLKAFQYFDKHDFAKDLDLIWENCLTYNTSPDSPYRFHAIKMRERCNEALKKVIEVEEEEDEEEENNVIEEIGIFFFLCLFVCIVVKDEVMSATGVVTSAASRNANSVISKDDEQMMDVVSDIESNIATGEAATLDISIEPVDEEMEENMIDYAADDCFLTYQ